MVWNLVEADSHESKAVYINYQAIAVLLVLVACTVGGVHFVHTQQVARHTPLVLQEAKQRLEKKEFASALTYFEMYLGYRPNDAEAIADYALLKAEFAQSRTAATEAFYTLRRAMNVAPNRHELVRRYVQLGVGLKRVEECQLELARLVQQSPNDPELVLLDARGAEQLGQHETARDKYVQVLASEAADDVVYLELIRLLFIELKDLSGADEWMIRLLERSPKSAEVHAYAANYYFQRGKLDLAEAELALAMTDPARVDPALLRLQAQIARTRRRPLELEASLTRLVELSVNDHRAELELAELEISLGRRVAAIQRLQRIGRDDAVSIEHLWRVIMLLDATGSAGDLKEFRTRLSQRDREGAYADSLAMRDKMIAQDWKGAIEISRPLLNRTNVSARYISTISVWRADCFEKTDDLEGMLAALRRAVAATGEDVTARSRLAQLLFRTGRFADAQSEYAALIQFSPIYAGEFVSLLHQAALGQTKTPLTRQEVDNLFDRWRLALPGQPLPTLSQLDFCLRMQDDMEVERLIQEGLKNWPQEVGFHLARISHLRQAGDWSAVFASLDEADAACGLQPTLLAQRIFCLEQAAPDDLQTQMLAAAESFQKLNRDSQSSVWPLLLKGLQRAAVDPARIAELQKSQIGINPHDPRTLLVQVQEAAAADDLETAQRHRDVLRDTTGEQSPEFKLAAVLCELRSGQQGDKQAFARAQEHLTLLLATPGEFGPIASTLQADLYLLQQRPQDALQHFLSAVQSGDRRLSTLNRTLSLMVLGGQLDQTIHFLKNLKPADSDRRFAAVPRQEVAAEDQLPRDLELPSLRDALAPSAAENWTIALVVSRIDLELGQPVQAQDRVQRAMELAPRQPIVWSEWLALIELQSSERLDAEVAKARAELPFLDQARLLPGILVRQKRPNDAKALLEKARQQAPTDPVIFQSWASLLRQASKQRTSREKLVTLLEETLADQRAEMKPCREIARRELALLWSASKDYREFHRAVELTEAMVRESGGVDEGALLLQAEINSLHVGHWQVAQAAYRQLQASSIPQRQAAAFSAEASIHERRRRWEEERAALEACRKLAANEPLLLARLLRNAVRRKDPSAAESLHQELHAATKDRGLLLQADVLKATFSEDHTKIVARIRAAYRDGQANRETVQEWLTMLKAYEPLQEILKRELDSARVDTVSRYAQILAQNQHFAEAMAQLSQLWKSSRSDAAMAVAVSLTSTTRISSEDLEPLRAATAALAESAEAPLPVLAAAASLEDFAGKHQAAEKLYRRIVAKSPDNVIAINNLAFLAAVSSSTPAAEHLAALEHVLETTGPVDQLLDTKGMLLLRSGDAQAAAQCFEEAWNQRGETSHLVHLAWAHSELGRTDEALRLFQLADAADPPARLHPLERPLDRAWRDKAASAVKSEQSAGLSQ